MKSASDCSAGPASVHESRQYFDKRAAGELPLSRRTELASDAFIAGRLVKLMNSIVNKRPVAEDVNPSLLDVGIELAKRLEQGDTYLTRRSTRLMQQPESASTVKYMRARGTSDIRAQTEDALSVLADIRSILDDTGRAGLSEVDPRLAESTRDFFRVVRTSINEQLAASQIPSQRVNVD